MMKRFPGKSVAALATAVAVVLVGGVAVAQIPGRDGVIHACRNKKSDDLRVVDSASQCKPKKETPLDWNQAGPQGPPGPAGTTAHVYFKQATVPPVALRAVTQVPVRTLPLPPGRYSVDALVTVSNLAAQPINIHCSVRSSPGGLEFPSGNSEAVAVGTQTTAVLQGIVEIRDVLPTHGDGAEILCSVQPTKTAVPSGTQLAWAHSWIRATEIKDYTLVEDN